MHLEHRLEIDVDPSVVWGLTEDIESWPRSTPTITRVERLDAGPLGVGATALITQPAQRPKVWTVTTFEPQRKFAWSARVFGMNVVAGHELEPAASGCVNILSLEISCGPTPLLGRLLRRQFEKAIATENHGFKAAAEGAIRS